MRLLSIDLSTHTGWSIFEDGRLVSYGLLEVVVDDFKADIKTYKDYRPTYPANLMKAANDMAIMVRLLIDEHKPDCIVLEEINVARARFSQKLLDWMHYALVEEFFRYGIKFFFLTTKCWSTHVQCYLKLWPEFRRWNGRVSRAKRKSKPTKAGARVAKIDGKVVAPIDRKKLSVIIANKHFGLSLKDDNIADSVNMGRAACELVLEMKCPQVE